LRALQFTLSLPVYLALRASGRLGLLRRGWVPGLRCVPVRPLPLPGPGWVRLRPLLSGVCGSDLALIKGQTSPALSPFVSFPAVLGHEVLATVEEVGGAVDGLAVGDRVVVDPFVSCTMRGRDPCPPCRRGESCLCVSTAEGPLAPGMLIGYCRDLPGGWSEEMVAHSSQIYRVPPALPDAAAVLVEPLAVAFHAVLKRPPAAGSRALILGAGPIGLLMIAALRFLAPSCHLTVVDRYRYQGAIASRLGADLVVPEGDGSGPDVAVTAAGARRYRPVVGRPVYGGGFDTVYDCVGTTRSVSDALRVAGPRAAIVLVGCAARVRHLDLSFVWARELEMTGSYGYSREAALAGSPHTFEVALRYLAEAGGAGLADLVTHRFALGQWRDAIRVNLQRKRHRTIKTVFDGRRPG
jgi:L-iditol 2-dehydrogenase